MASALPPFAISELRDDELLSFVQVNEQQYQCTVERHPDAALSYLDDDDGERVTIGSGLELRQRLEDPTHATSPSTRFYDSDSNAFRDQAVHVFDIRQTNASRTAWSEHRRIFKRRQSYEMIQGEKARCGSSSPELVESSAKAHRSNDVHVQPRSQPAHENPTDIDLTTILSDAIPDMVENLAQLLQTTSDTLRKAAERTREAKTSPIEDVLSGMGNIVTEIGSFGLSILDHFGQVTLDTGSQQADHVQESLKHSEVSTISKDTAIYSQAFDADFDSSVESLLNKPYTQHWADSFSNVAEVREEQSSISDLQKLSLMHTSTEQKDNSILDQDTEDADFSRRYPPLISLRRANTIAGLHDRFDRSDNFKIDEYGLKRSDSWSRRFPHRPAPRVFDEETQRRKDFARNCFPGQQYTPGPGAQAIDSPPRSITTGPEVRKRGWNLNRSLRDGSVATQPHNAHLATVSDMRASSGSSEVADLTVARSQESKQGSTTESSKTSLPGAWPETIEPRSATNGPPGESSGAFFYRMMRDNPSRKQEHVAESTDRLARYRSFSRPKPSNNPFSELNRSNTTGGVSNPAARLNRPFDPTYPIPLPIVPLAEAKPSSEAPSSNTSQPRTFKVPPKVADKPSWLQRPFSPVWEDDLDQPRIRGKDSSGQPGPFDRNGESISMYSPPPRHMRSLPNFANVRTNTCDLVGSADNEFQANLSIKGKRAAFENPSALLRPTVSDPLQRPYRDPFPQNQGLVMSKFQQNASKTAVPAMHTSPVSPSLSDPSMERATRPKVNFVDPVAECVRALRDMGYGVSDENLNSRLHVYAVAAHGDVVEALEMIEDDKRAHFGFDIEQQLQMRTL